MVNTLVIRLAMLLSLILPLASAQTTRPVTISWSAGQAGITGWNLGRGTSTTGPFTQLNTSAISGTSYTDSTAVVGNVYTYVLTPIAAACTATTPLTSVCGQGITGPGSTTNVPPQPTVTVTVTIAVP
jgi:hypothetical protein